MPNVNFDYSVNEVVYVIGPSICGIAKGTIVDVDIEFTLAATTPIITYSIKMDLTNTVQKFDQSVVFGTLRDYGSPAVQGALSAYAATIV